MRKPKTITKALLLIASIVAASVLGQAQNAVKSVGSIKRSETGKFEVHVSYSSPVGSANAADFSITGPNGDVSIDSVSRISNLTDPTALYRDLTIPDSSPLGEDFAGKPAIDAWVSPEGRPVDNSVVILEVGNLEVGAEYNLSATVSGTEEYSGSFEGSPFTYTRIGARREGGQLGNTVAVDDDGFDIFSSGATQWSNYDETDYVWIEADGNFDISAQVVYQDFSSQWARAGLMAREALDEDRPSTGNPQNEDPEGFSIYTTAHTNPPHDFEGDGSAIGGGNNNYENNRRTIQGGASAGGGNRGDIGFVYPDNWVRLVRDGDTITSWVSEDGENWNAMNEGITFESLASPIHIGPSYSSESGNAAPFLSGKVTMAQIRNVQWEITPFEPGQVDVGPEDTEISANDTLMLSVSGSGSSPRYQWFKDGTAIDGATQATLEVVGVQPSDAGIYTVSVTNPSGVGETSDGATVTVLPDTTPPSPIYAINIVDNTLEILFTEAIDPNTGGTASNYRIQGGSVSRAEVDGNDSRKVNLSFSGVSYTEVATLTINGVKDTANNTIGAETTIAFQGQAVDGIQFFFGDAPDDTFTPKTPVILPTDLRTDPSTGGQKGMNVRTVWSGSGTLDSVESAEILLADPSVSNQANPASTVISIEGGAGFGFGGVAFEQEANGTVFSTLGVDPFSAFPGIDPQDANQFAVEIVTYLHLKPGVYSFGNNSDDGVQVTLANEYRDGAFIVGGDARNQGYSGNIGPENYYNFIVTEEGLYPFRVLYWENGGGAALDWTTVDGESLNFESLVGQNTNITTAYATRTNVGGVDDPSGDNPLPGPDYPLMSDGSLSETTTVDIGNLSGDATFVFSFNAVSGGASTAIAGNDSWALKLDQWNNQGVFGTTQFGVADNLFEAVGGQSLASVFNEDVHVAFVNDTGAGETRLYVNGTHVGTSGSNIALSGEVRLMGARLGNPVDVMGEGSTMHSWAVYDMVLSDDEIAAMGGGDGGGDATASIADNGDGTVTITYEGTLQSSDSVNGGYADVAGASSPHTVNAEGAARFYRVQ